MIKECKFEYKAQRNYVHGTDMFKEFISQIDDHSAVNKLDFTVNKMAHNNLKMLIIDEADTERPKEFAARLISKSGDKSYKLFLIETDQNINDRYEYDEELIANESEIIEEEIRSSYSQGYSTIEAIVALQKSLLTKLGLNNGKKWVFTRLELTKLFNNDHFDNISIKLVKNLSGKLFKSEVKINNEQYGYIYFSLI